MMVPETTSKLSRPFAVEFSPPGSKSLTNRALILAALSEGPCRLSNVLLADDTAVMLDGLAKLGFELKIDRPGRVVEVAGRGGAIPAAGAELFCGNSGTTIRFLAALCVLGQGEFTLDGIARMRQRPIAELGDVLARLGAGVDYLDRAGFPPLKLTSALFNGGAIDYGSAASSQFLSAVLMVSPFAAEEMHVRLQGQQTSWPYVWMTMRMMDQFGVTPELMRDTETGLPKMISVPQDRYGGTDYRIEPDASNAMYFLTAAALHEGSSFTVPGLGSDSLQGDVQFVKILQKMGAAVVIEKQSVRVTGTGVLKGVDVDLLDMPDQAQTLGVAALFATGKTTLRGLHTLKLKETDRLTALSTELRKFGATVEAGEDTLVVTPPKTPTAASVATYDDHRMAMSFALAATRIDGVVIQDPHCVNKTYPEFFRDLQRLRNLD